ncbi:MAG: glutamate 5-kinase, partial [Pseudomonadota bacterium]
MATPSSATARPALANARRIVVKVGTRVLTRDDGRPALTRLAGIIEQLADLHHAGREVLLVSSGAVGLGCERLKLEPPLTPAQRQACAAVGQMPLMALYEQGFSRFGIVCAQLLLTRRDFSLRQSYLSLQHTMGSLLR